MRELGRFLMILGAVVALSGAVLYFWPKLPLGRLPGDIVVERENFKFYFPWVTSLMISLVLSILYWLFRR
ncbi:MAG: DUF2905 domain-containing protein [Deltaproteobacteria bacterium]|nr:DUF2905 domain-containing protein [Deltaproteobacteria bacterium]